MKQTRKITNVSFGVGLILLLCLAFLMSRAALEPTCVDPPDGLVSWWDGDTVSGVTAFDIQDGNDGTMVGGVSVNPGKVGNAFSFDGVNDYISLGTTQIIGDDTSFTIDAWIKVNSFAFNYQLAIYGEFYANQCKNYLGVGSFQSYLHRRVFFDQYPPGGGFLVSTIQLIEGQWYHVAYTQDGTTRCLYINGTLDNSDSVIETYTGYQPSTIRIGRRGVMYQRFNGLIDELEIFNRALSADEILAIYNAGSVGKCKVIKVIAVDVDIKPGGDPNSIYPIGGGRIPVAILTTEAFDASTVDWSTVRFGPNGAAPVHWGLEDVDFDGDIDMILHFEIQETGIQCGDTTADLTGETFVGQEIEGSDSIRIVGCD